VRERRGGLGGGGDGGGHVVRARGRRVEHPASAAGGLRGGASTEEVSEHAAHEAVMVDGGRAPTPTASGTNI
jgi:hypothetical protein